MAATILDGKALAAKTKESVRLEAAALPRKPGLAVILVGDDPASRVYVTSKRKDCEECGFYSEEYALPAETTQGSLLALVEELNRREDIDGILCQLPLPKGLDEKEVLLAKKGRKFNGQMFLSYLVWYGLGRSAIEGLRTDSLYFFGTGIRSSQLLGLVSAAAGIALFVYRWKTAGPADPPFVKEQNETSTAEAVEAAPEEQHEAAAADEAVLEKQSETVAEEQSEAVVAVAVEAAAEEETKEEDDNGGDDS